MHAGDDGFSFECSATTRRCAEAREIRLTDFALRPLGARTLEGWAYEELMHRGIAESEWTGVDWAAALKGQVKELIRRTRKYDAHGFRFQSRAP